MTMIIYDVAMCEFFGKEEYIFKKRSNTCAVVLMNSITVSDRKCKFSHTPWLVGF